jgi:hypothetical protein
MERGDKVVVAHDLALDVDVAAARPGAAARR